MKTPNERLREIREKRGFKNARDAARAYGWKISAYASHENGHRDIPPDKAIQYTTVFGVSMDWLYKGVEPNKSAGVGTIPNIAYRRVPRLNWDFMKIYGGLEKAMEMATEFSSLPQHLEILMPAFTLSVEGDSMMNEPGKKPSFEPGDELIFSTKAKIRPGDFVLAELFDENAVVFRQYRERGRNADGFMTYELTPLNPVFETKLIASADQARIVAKMTHKIESYS